MEKSPLKKKDYKHVIICFKCFLIKNLPEKIIWDNIMVKEKSTTCISLSLMKVLLDISEITHSNLICQLLKCWCWQHLNNKLARLSLKQICWTSILSFCRRSCVKKKFDEIYFVYYPLMYSPFNIKLYVHHYIHTWWMEYLFLKKNHIVPAVCVISNMCVR